LLPDTLTARGSAEAWCFSLVWIAVAVSAYLWRHQPLQLRRRLFGLLAVLALGLPLLNGLTAPDGHLVASLLRGDLMLAGIDMVLLMVGGLCAWRSLRRTPQQHSTRREARTAMQEQELAP
jgi:hypothetical protein